MNESLSFFYNFELSWNATANEFKWKLQICFWWRVIKSHLMWLTSSASIVLNSQTTFSIHQNKFYCHFTVIPLELNVQCRYRYFSNFLSMRRKFENSSTHFAKPIHYICMYVYCVLSVNWPQFQCQPQWNADYWVYRRMRRIPNTFITADADDKCKEEVERGMSNSTQIMFFRVIYKWFHYTNR